MTAVFKCSVCLIDTSNKRKLTEHILRKHNTDRPFVCGDCCEGFAVRWDLNHHVKLKHNDRLLCMHCGKRSRDAKQFEKHCLNGCFECPRRSCHQRFISQQELKVHLNTECRNRFVCEICGRFLPNKLIYETHVKTHNDYLKLPKCKFCIMHFPYADIEHHQTVCANTVEIGRRVVEARELLRKNQMFRIGQEGMSTSSQTTTHTSTGGQSVATLDVLDIDSFLLSNTLNASTGILDNGPSGSGETISVTNRQFRCWACKLIVSSTSALVAHIRTCNVVAPAVRSRNKIHRQQQSSNDKNDLIASADRLSIITNCDLHQSEMVYISSPSVGANQEISSCVDDGMSDVIDLHHSTSFMSPSQSSPIFSCGIEVGHHPFPLPDNLI